jgi:hypothetical protein
MSFYTLQVYTAAYINLRVWIKTTSQKIINSLFRRQIFIRSNEEPIPLLSLFPKFVSECCLSFWPDSSKATHRKTLLTCWPHRWSLKSYGVIVLWKLPWSSVQVQASETRVLAFIPCLQEVGHTLPPVDIH